MTYLLLCLPFLSVAAAFAIVGLPNGRAARRRRLIAVAGAFVVLFALTAVFDTVMIAAGLFTYARGSRLGPVIGLAPIEDFAYPLATALLVPAVWTVASRLGGYRRDDGD